VGADVVRIVRKAASTRRKRPGAIDPAGVQELGMCAWGSLGNVGGPVASPLKDPDGAAGIKALATASVSEAVGANAGTSAVTVKRRRRSLTGWAAGSRSTAYYQ
jgi:hypothetical protein